MRRLARLTARPRPLPVRRTSLRSLSLGRLGLCALGGGGGSALALALGGGLVGLVERRLPFARSQRQRIRRLAHQPLRRRIYAATVVAYKGSNRKNKFFIHFDVPCDGVTTEKVDLRSADIRIMFDRVTVCTCSQCATTDGGQRTLPLLVDITSGGLLPA